MGFKNWFETAGVSYYRGFSIEFGVKITEFEYSKTKRNISVDSKATSPSGSPPENPQALDILNYS